jgi:NitT/TauT family transport system substrate-binding protein
VAPSFRRLAPILVCALAIAGLAACGGDDGGGAEDGGDVSRESPAKVRVGETAGVPFAFLKFGVDKGFYREVGLDVEPIPVQGAAPIVTAVVNGDYQMGGSDTATFTQGLSRNLPLTMITPGTSVSDRSRADFSALMVPSDSGITKPSDLRGRTVAVNILGNISEVSLSGALNELGVDPTALEFTEVPFPEMVPAVEEGRVDAAFAIEPFRTIGLAGGGESLFGPFSTFEPGLQIGSIITTREYAERNSDAVAAFQKAHAKTARYVSSHEREFRKALPDIAELEPELAQRVNLPVWHERVDRESVERVADAMVEQGLIDERPDVAGAVHEGA